MLGNGTHSQGVRAVGDCLVGTSLGHVLFSS
jgi:hypothetical protein